MSDIVDKTADFVARNGEEGREGRREGGRKGGREGRKRREENRGREGGRHREGGGEAKQHTIPEDRYQFLWKKVHYIAASDETQTHVHVLYMYMYMYMYMYIQWSVIIMDTVKVKYVYNVHV